MLLLFLYPLPPNNQLVLTRSHTMTPFDMSGKESFSKHCGKSRQEGHDGPEIAHLSLLTKHAPSSFPVT